MLDKKLISFLACPVCHKDLNKLGEEKLLCPNCLREYPIKDGIAVFMIEQILAKLSDLPPEESRYWELWKTKQGKTADYYAKTENAEFQKWYNYLTSNFRRFSHLIGGNILDVGCGQPEASLRYFNMEKGSYYIGLDPFIVNVKTNYPLIQGVSEYLPIKSSTIDSVLFLTTLDHMTDPKRSLLEAKRVLRPGGRIYIVSLVWNDQFSLERDESHFHHFSRDELQKCFVVSGFKVLREDYIPWKQDDYRSVGFFELEKE